MSDFGICGLYPRTIDPLSEIADTDVVRDSIVVSGTDLADAETAWHMVTTGRKVTLIDSRDG